MAAKQQGVPFDLSTQASGLFLFAALAVGLVWLGIGSIQAKRWARALLLCLGWVGLCVGVISLIVVMATLSSMDAVMRQSGQELPPGALLIGKIIAVCVVLVMYVIIPGALVLFYRSRHVKLTCEARDPVARWTDRCPLPVLAWCLLQVYGAVAMLLVWKFAGAVPLFGYVLTGWSAHAIWVGFSLFCLWAARGFYRLNPRAWLAYTTLMFLGGLSSLVTFSRIGLLDYYRIMGLPEWQIKQIAVSPLVQGHNFLWGSTVGLAIFLGYLVFLRRYFVRPPAG
jgi:hypothetical protein